MTTAICLRALLVVSLSEPAAQPPAPPTFTAVQLNVFTHAAVDVPTLDLAKATAGQLLASARVAAEWRHCDAAAGACGQHGVAAPLSVLLMPVLKLARAEVSAEVVRDPSTHEPTVIVYLPNLIERARTVRQSTAGRSSPPLATLQLGHLLGLAVAHEVGHALGLRHERTGVMKARLELDDLLALRTSRLVFTSKHASAPRPTLVARARDVASDGR
jgi:hypothetical protein